MIGYAIVMVEKGLRHAEPVFLKDGGNPDASIWIIYTAREDAQACVDESYHNDDEVEYGLVEVRIEANKRVDLN